MRKLIVVFLAISLFTSCNNNKKDVRGERRTETDDYRNSQDEKDKDENKDNDRDTKYSSDNEEKDNRDNERRSSGNWRDEEVNVFVENCVSEAVRSGLTKGKATDYCECMQRKLEDKYPNAVEIANLKTESPEMQDMIKKCLGM